MPAAKVFTIAPGVPFLETFAKALRAGAILPGLNDPLALAGTTIYVPTRRAGRALSGALARAYGGGAILLPHIRALGAMEEGELGFAAQDLGDSGGLASDIAPAIGTIDRRLLLSKLILKWGQELTHAIISIDENGVKALAQEEPALVATTLAGAWHLSGDLAHLIDELIIEGIDWGAIDGLADDFDKYWRVTTDFLDIAITQWPHILKGLGLVDGARRQMLFAQRQIEALTRGRHLSPVIMLGSTGTNRAVAQLMAAVARAPQGAVVLPGLDHNLDAVSFSEIGLRDERGELRATTHPQAALARLLPVLGVGLQDCAELAQLDDAMAARMRFVSQALRPAESTELWRQYMAGSGASDIETGLNGIRLIIANDEREEALALAIAMREALEDDQANIALITPDRSLASRVAAELLRWNIEIDDSGGDSLAVTGYGTLAQLALACALSNGAAQDKIALLSHELVGFGGPRLHVAEHAPLIEIGVLRVLLPDFDMNEANETVEAARAAAGEPRAYAAAAAITETQWDTIEVLLQSLADALAPLRGLHHELALTEWVKAHRFAVEALVSLEEGDNKTREAGACLTQLFAELEAASLPDLCFDGVSYMAFFRELAREAVVRGPQRGHPRLKILGLLEARLLQADLVLLAGLDEATWPPQPTSDAFLNRPMRAKLGLTTPERRIGQTAHDFVQGLGNRQAILSRARKRGGKPMVASRFLQRLEALAGARWQACIAAGGRYLGFARALDASAVRTPIARPAPCPPVDLRPTQLSVTRIDTLRRDPYAIYAEKVLRLRALDPLGIASGARETGTAIHEILADFVRAHPVGPLPNDAEQSLMALATEKMQNELANAAFRAFNWPRLQAALQFYLRFETAQRENAAGALKIRIETIGMMSLKLKDGSSFKLTAQADRIEIIDQKRAYLFDYKTGTAPTTSQVEAGFATQLTLEALMFEAGAFDKQNPKMHVENAAYVKLGGADGGKDLGFVAKDHDTFAALVKEHGEGLLELLNQFRDPSQGYPSQPYPKFVPRYSDYAHLARVAEWAANISGED